MPRIHVAKSFTLTHDDGVSRRFEAGHHEVEEHVAEHWYVRAHLVGVPPVAPKPGSYDFASQAKAQQAEAARLRAEAEADAAVEAERQRAERAAQLRDKTQRAISESAEAAERAAEKGRK